MVSSRKKRSFLPEKKFSSPKNTPENGFFISKNTPEKGGVFPPKTLLKKEFSGLKVPQDFRSVLGGRDLGVQRLPLFQGAPSLSWSTSSCSGQPGGSLAPRTMRSLPGKVIPGDGQDVEKTTPRKTQPFRAAQLPRAHFQHGPVCRRCWNEEHPSQSREGAPRLSLVAQEQTASDSRQQLSLFLQKFPSAPLWDQNFPSTTREQLSPRSCASLPARIRGSLPQESCQKHRFFSPRGTVLFIMFVAQATQRAQIALGTRAGLW